MLKMDDIKEGITIIPDGNFRCMNEGQGYEVKKDDQGFYVSCKHRWHYLENQRGENGECIGFKLLESA